MHCFVCFPVSMVVRRLIVLAFHGFRPARVCIIAASLFCWSCSSSSYLDSHGRLQTLPAEKKTQHEAEFLYTMLAGEFAHRAGDWQVAAEYYLQAARHTDSLPVLERALAVLLQANHYKKAVEVGTKILGHSTGRNFKIAMTALYLQTGDATRAARLAQQLMAEGALPAQLFGRLYQAYMETSKFGGSYAALERFSGHFPEQAEAQTFVATAAFHAADFDQTLAAIDRILRIRADDPSAYYLKARLLIGNGQIEQGFYFWRKALLKQPDNVEQRVYYAQTLSEHHYAKESYEEFLYLHFQYPDHPEYIKALGQLAIHRKQYEDAWNWFSLLTDYPHRANEALYFQGRVLEEQGDYDQALSFYARVPAGDHRLYRKAQLGVVRIYQLRGNVESALAYLEETRENTSNYSLKLETYLLQGEVLSKAGLVQREFDLYTQAINNYMDAEPLLYARALAASRLNLVHFVEKDINRILARNPDNPQALNALGYEFAKRNVRLEEAKQYIVRAHRLAPNDPAILDSMGWVEFRLKNYSLAEVYVRRAMLDLYEAEIVGHLVEVMRAQRRFQEAERLLNKALTDFPDDEYLNLLLEHR